MVKPSKAGEARDGAGSWSRLPTPVMRIIADSHPPRCLFPTKRLNPTKCLCPTKCLYPTRCG